MIALFLTFMISIFCCSSFNFNGLKDSSFFRDSNELQINENENIKSAVFNDDECYIDAGVMFSSQFINYFIEGLILNGGYSQYSLSYLTNYTNTFTNINAQWIYSNDMSWSSNQVYSINALRLSKTYVESKVDTNNDNYDIFDFNLYLLNNNTAIATINYRLFSYNTNLVLPFVLSPYNHFALYHEIKDDTHNHPIIDYFIPIFDSHLYSESQTYSAGYSQGYDTGYQDGKGNGYQSGYNQGLIDGSTYDDTALTIFTGFIEVGLLPVNIFLQILNFEVFGINIAGFVSALLTISIVIIVIRVITGKKDD